MALSEFEKKMKRANTILYNADKMGLSNDAIENARHMLELTYKNMQDTFKARNNKGLNYRNDQSSQLTIHSPNYYPFPTQLQK